MEWIKPFVDEDILSFRDDINDEIYIEKIKLDNIKVTRVPLIAQLFLVNHVLFNKPGLVTAIPIGNVEAEKLCLENLAIHFENIQKVHVNGCLERIQLRDIKQTSKNIIQNMIRNNEIHPYIKEFYFLPTEDNLEDRYNNFNENQILFEVLKDKFSSISFQDPELVETTTFIKNTFGIKNERFTLLPLGWYLEEKLKSLNMLNLFIQIFSSTFITIDSKSEKVLYIYFENKI